MAIQLTPEQRKALGMEAYSTPQSQQRFMERIGKVVFDGAMSRLIASLTPDQVYALDYAIERCDSFSCVIEYVERTYPQFKSYLREEQEAFISAYVAELERVRK